MDEIYILLIGFAGLICSITYRIPQIYRIYKIKSGNDISSWTIHVQNISYVLYTIYGILDNDLVYIVSSIIALLQNMIILWLKYKYS